MVKLEEKENGLTAYLSGDIDHHTAGEIRELIDSKAEQVRPQTLNLDFKDVTFMDSSGIGLVMGRYKLRAMPVWQQPVFLHSSTPR